MDLTREEMQAASELTVDSGNRMTMQEGHEEHEAPHGEATQLVSTGDVELTHLDAKKMASHDPVTGQFLPGWQGGPGRPPKLQENRFAAMLAAVFDPETVAQMQESLKAKVKAGNTKTLDALLPYLAPKLASQTIDLSGNGPDGSITLELVPGKRQDKE
jgi:hypothetical protein